MVDNSHSAAPTVRRNRQPQAMQPTAPGSSLPQAPRLSPRCTYCGSLPTAWVDFHAHHGYVLLRRTVTFSGPFCRDCGIATFRKSTARTLVAGWWGYFSVLITPWYLITNLLHRGKVAKLPAPQSAFEGRAPLSVGRPVYLRWQMIGVLFPFIVIALIVAITTAELNRPG